MTGRIAPGEAARVRPQAPEPFGGHRPDPSRRSGLRAGEEIEPCANRQEPDPGQPLVGANGEDFLPRRTEGDEA